MLKFTLFISIIVNIALVYWIIDLPQIHDPRGDLTFVEGGNHIPFQIARVYYLYNVPVDAERGGHAHRDLEQVVFALSGSFRMKVDDGQTKSEYWLRDPRKGPWRDFSGHLYSMGATALPITALVGFLIGVVLAYLMALQLRQFGAEAVSDDVAPVMPGEDLGFFAQTWPSAMAWLGAHAPERGAAFPLHSGKYVLDESVLHLGVAMHAGVAARFLGENGF